MGADFSTKGVIGVRLEKLYTTKKETVKITKYNPDTGAPYQADSVTEHYFWCGEEIEEPNDIYDLVRQKTGYDIHTSGEGDDNIVGFLIADLEAPDVASINGPTLSQKWTEVKERLIKAGYKENGVQLHIIAYVAV